MNGTTLIIVALVMILALAGGFGLRFSPNGVITGFIVSFSAGRNG